MHMHRRILIVEDDEAIATGLALNLKIAGYDPSIVYDGGTALEKIQQDPPDLILLDVNLPKVDGIALVAELRGMRNYTPIIMVSAREDEYDKVAALRLGADDYITKPFALAELLARVDAVLRRCLRDSFVPPMLPAAPAAPTVSTESARSFGDIAMDISTRTVSRAGEEVKLTHLEFELLSFFVQHPSQVFSRDQLLRDVWGQRSGSQRTIDNFVAQLRSKLEADPEYPRHFITVRGSGYRFDP